MDESKSKMDDIMPFTTKMLKTLFEKELPKLPEEDKEKLLASVMITVMMGMIIDSPPKKGMDI